ncbi:uncharacterized protein EI90DRAFT_3018052 [Cantharellus anzutake]|uniref:uncharacterized protein n=1 Tax=Cantharellus anzutake TaxID=1750568 RepID=UPI0019040EC3|nr:uncharacterized protein EI90DRAFT_3018052 [Cantharellus anzutake]KAF8327539.1 hypothetical protein EI90DRAFT_3018052 [Cantharellus anzutake]
MDTARPTTSTVDFGFSVNRAHLRGNLVDLTTIVSLWKALFFRRHSETLPPIEESVKLRRQLAAIHPGSHVLHLAASLNNICGALSEALPFIQESVKLGRRLASIHPGSHTLYLATIYMVLLDGTARPFHASKKASN